jgi:hypothetical protein
LPKWGKEQDQQIRKEKLILEGQDIFQMRHARTLIHTLPKRRRRQLQPGKCQEGRKRGEEHKKGIRTAKGHQGGIRHLPTIHHHLHTSTSPLGVSDGSVLLSQGTFGWALATTQPPHQLLHCSGPAFGASMDSYRAEAYGLLSLATLLALMSRFFHRPLPPNLSSSSFTFFTTC